MQQKFAMFLIDFNYNLRDAFLLLKQNINVKENYNLLWGLSPSTVKKLN